MILFLVFFVYLVWTFPHGNITLIMSGVLFYILYFLFLLWYYNASFPINSKNPVRYFELKNTLVSIVLYICIIFWLFYLVERWYIVFNYSIWWYLIPYTIGLIFYHDAFFYFSHRCMHHPVLYWYGHAEHHKSHTPNYMSWYSFGILEAFIYVITVIPIFFIPLNLFALLWAVFANDFVTIIGHSWKEIFPKKYKNTRFYKCIVNATFHDIHHTHNNWNYAAYFLFWDKLFWTYSPSYDEVFTHIKRNHEYLEK